MKNIRRKGGEKGRWSSFSPPRLLHGDGSWWNNRQENNSQRRNPFLSLSTRKHGS
ncbi:Hypothetical protein FKW44_023087 [Caligus rogercresseyi]|uniref:Uncharacterized protein n=1 Tax=Caligus rogercresseyi TaxID=217165 RepID=A0A7T8GNI3_CALRO|nr:Hypothetical protein FKW44_023087 [Caligus rogercresseyi]